MAIDLLAWQAFAVLAAALAAWFLWQAGANAWRAARPDRRPLPDQLDSPPAPSDRLTALERMPLLERLIGQPLILIGRSVFRRQSVAGVEDDLRRSGWVFGSVGDLYGSKIGLGLLALLAATALLVLAGQGPQVIAAGGLVAGMVGLYLPDVLVRRTIQRRRLNVIREMGWTVDRLATIMVTGQAIQPALSRMTNAEYSWLAAGSGGLFMAMIRDLAIGFASGDADREQFFVRLRSTLPNGIPELDEFLHIIEVHHRRGAPVVGQLRALGRVMRDAQNVRILAAEQQVLVTLSLMCGGIIAPAFMLSAVGPLIVEFAVRMSGY